MFDFAISQYEKHPPSRRFFAAWIASCTLHVIAVLLLIEYPELLSPGLNRWLRQPSLLTSIFSPSSNQRGQDSNWRTVAILGKSSNNRMVTPSAETLRKYMYDWSKNGYGTPPVRVRWGNEKLGAAEAAESASKSRPVPGTQEPKPVDVAAEKAAAAAQANELAKPGGEAPAGGSSGAQVAAVDPAAGKGTVYLPAAQPPGDKAVKKTAETSPSTAPTSIPTGINPPPAPLTAPSAKPTNPAQAKTETKVFEDQQKAIRTEGSGLFGTKGFPLGEYAHAIIERVKENWMIPSNLRNSQGRTTVLFYIDRDGRFTDARIITSSGSSSLDLAALNAVIESNPFPPLPRGFPGDRVGAKFVFSYNEHQ